MNQHRWNCLTALFLSTFIAPISSVRAEVTPPAVSGQNDLLPTSSATVLPVTPLATPLLDARIDSQFAPAVPVIQLVPQVSSLPLVVPVAKSSKSTPTKQLKIAKIGTFLPTKPTYLPSPVVPIAAKAANFSPSLRATAASATFPHHFDSASVFPDLPASSPGTVGAVAPLTQPTATTPATPSAKPFTTQAASAPIYVSRSDNAKLTKALIPPTITTATVQAEMTVTPLVENSGASSEPTVKTATAAMPTAVATPVLESTQPTLVPKVAPLAQYPPERAEIPSFESGLPAAIFEEDKPPQIVATAIAQVGNDIVAPEPSIAIPVERPKQATVPTQVPVATPTISKVEPAATTPVFDNIVSTQSGQASWYGAESGNRTANGERFNPAAMTAAHRTLPFGTMVRVTSLKTGKAVIVRINDRGPFRSRRIVDLSAGAAEIIGLKSHGVGNVRMDILDPQG